MCIDCPINATCLRINSLILEMVHCTKSKLGGGVLILLVINKCRVTTMPVVSFVILASNVVKVILVLYVNSVIQKV